MQGNDEMRPLSATYRRLLALVGCIAALAAAGCGADEEKDPGAPIPAAQAQQLDNLLSEVQRRFDFGDGACADVQNDSRPSIEQVLSAIPQRVSADVRSTLADGFQRLFQLSREQCDEQRGQQTETTETPTETETTPTTPTVTETVPTTPTETETTPTTPTVPVPDTPGNGNGNGQGKAKGKDKLPENQGGGVSPTEAP
jgi:hypothetical protein